MPTLALSTVVLSAPGRRADAGCNQPIAIVHFSPGSAGAFVLPEMAGRPNGPALRFWQFGQYMAANSGRQGQFDDDGPWLLGAGSGKVPGAPPDHFWLYQANWLGPAVAGCPMDLPMEARRTVVEVSYLFEENRPTHHTGYLIVSVGFVPSFDFNFDSIVNGNGGGAVVKMVPVPTPVAVGPAVASSNKSFMEVTLQIPDAKSYGDGGAPNLIAGYEVFYKNDEVPVSSDPGHYRPVRNPSAPSTELGIVPYGSGSVRVAVPKPQRSSYFAMRIQYLDGTTRIFSQGTGGHSEPVTSPDAVNADKAASPTPSPTPATAEPTPEPTATPLPTEDTATPDGGTGSRSRNEGAGTAGDDSRTETAPAAGAPPLSATAGSETTGVTIGGLAGGGAPRAERAATPARAADARGGSDASPAGDRVRPFSDATFARDRGIAGTESAAGPGGSAGIGDGSDPTRSGGEARIASNSGGALPGGEPDSALTTGSGRGAQRGSSEGAPSADTPVSQAGGAGDLALGSGRTGANAGAVAGLWQDVSGGVSREPSSPGRPWSLWSVLDGLVVLSVVVLGMMVATGRANG